MMTHEEAGELLAAFALNAVEGDEYELIAQHLAICLRCEAEVDAHLEVVAALGNSVEPLPADLWWTISNRLTARDDVEMLLSPVERRQVRRDLAEIRQSRSGTVRSSRPRMAAAASAAIGSAAVATVLGIGLANANNQVAHLQGAVGETSHTELLAALETPGHYVVTLTDGHHHDLAQFVVLPNGRGYLMTSTLPALPSGETYQLWGVIRDKTISLGLLGPTPHLATFTAAGSARPHSLGITVETAAGARQPSGPMLASGMT
jgi:hypothetical protein